MNPVQPTSDQCVDNSEIPCHDGEYSFATWHPQWGGYGGKCLVTFSVASGSGEGEPGCFHVDNWHNGEYPSDTEVTSYHYCDAGQLVNFGLKVMERQLQTQNQTGSYKVPAEGGPVRLNRDWAEGVIERIQELLDADSKHDNPKDPEE